jgi:hypothetical protein
MCNFKENMLRTEAVNIEYLSKVFKGLSIEKKDCILNTARFLLKIQDDNIYLASANKPIFHNKKLGIVQGR